MCGPVSAVHNRSPFQCARRLTSSGEQLVLMSTPRALSVLWLATFSIAACSVQEANLSDSVVTRVIVPSHTSPAIVPTVGDHFVALGPAVSRIGTLLVYYPGTQGRPDQYSALLRRAAALGYHAIGLAYDNTASINFDICPGQPETCHEDARLEILLGIESGYSPPNVNPENAVFERLFRLLQYLNQRWPDEGWGAYLETSGALEWSRIAFGGHSQGGGHAAMTAKLHSVARVLLFDATEPVAWTTAVLETPSDRFFGFVHAREPLYEPITTSWENLRIPGVLTSTDAALAPYNSHRLSTAVLVCNGPPTDPAYYHNCPVVDDFLPLTDSGVPQFQPVWDYMLTAPAP